MRKKKPLKGERTVSDKSREYEELLKQFESKYPARSDNDRQRQPQSRYSEERSLSQRTPQQRTSTAQTSRRPVNNRAYTGQHIPQKRRTAKKRNRCRLLGISAAVLAIILLAILIIVVAKSCSSGTNVLSGTWALDGTTAYQFDGNGKGAMVLHAVSYDFTYTIDGNKLVIDYKNESVHDATYEFTVDGDTLTLVGGEGTIGGTYELTKTNDG